MEITLSAVTEAGRSRLAAVTAEVAGHVVLLTIQQLPPNPRHIQPGTIWLTDTGDVRVQPLGEASPLEIETELRQLLATLIGLSPTTPPALKAAAEGIAGAGLDVLRAELHAALIPINHAAARRALARLYRETHRASGAGTIQRDAMSSDLPPLPPISSGATLARSLIDRIDELEIDVDVVGDDGLGEVVTEPVAGAAGPLLDHERPAEPGDAPVLSTTSETADVERVTEKGDEHIAHRSDLGQLLASFLAHTRSEERMTEDLRQMLGVASSQPRSNEVGAVSEAPPVASRH